MPTRDEVLAALERPEAFLAFDPRTGEVPTAALPQDAAPGPRPALGTPAASGQSGFGAAPERPGFGTALTRALGRQFLGRISPELVDFIPPPLPEEPKIERKVVGGRLVEVDDQSRTRVLLDRPEELLGQNLYDKETKEVFPASRRDAVDLVRRNPRRFQLGVPEESALVGKTFEDQDTGREFFVSEENAPFGRELLEENPFRLREVRPPQVGSINVDIREGQERRAASSQILGQAGRALRILQDSPPGVVGFRGMLAQRMGGLAGAFDAAAEKRVASWFAGGKVDPGELRQLRTLLNAIAFQSKEVLTGEGTSRVSEGERALALQAAGTVDAFSSREQVQGAILELTGLKIINDEILAREIGDPVRFPVETREDIVQTNERLRQVFPPEAADRLTRRLIQEARVTRLLGG